MLNRASITALILLSGFALVPLVTDTYGTNLVSQILIFSLLAMSIDLLAGFAGRTSLCHGALFGTASYVMIYYTTMMSGSLIVGAMLAILASTVLAGVIASLAVRTRGAYFLLLTLALGMVVWGLSVRWTTITGGENGMRGTIRPNWLMSAESFYYSILVVFALAGGLLWRISQSPFGLSLKGIRESETRMQALGYNVPLHLFIAFVITGAFAGISGVAYAFFNGFVSPTTVSLAQSVQGLLMVIVGGAGTLLGSILGAVIVIKVEDWVSAVTDRWSLVIGLLFIVTMLVAPEGILGRISAARRKQQHAQTHSH
jgi:branched-chain amino acid transport system permease protein